jgi:hypothetical protein
MKQEFKTLFDKEGNFNCECKKCKCERCGQRKLYQDRRTIKISPNHYRLYDVWKCPKCNYQWIEQLGEQKYENPQPMEIKSEIIN